MPSAPVRRGPLISKFGAGLLTPPKLLTDGLPSAQAGGDLRSMPVRGRETPAQHGAPPHHHPSALVPPAACYFASLSHWERAGVRVFRSLLQQAYAL